jgi:hypothetical protein
MGISGVLCRLDQQELATLKAIFNREAAVDLLLEMVDAPFGDYKSFTVGKLWGNMERIYESGLALENRSVGKLFRNTLSIKVSYLSFSQAYLFNVEETALIANALMAIDNASFAEYFAFWLQSKGLHPKDISFQEDVYFSIHKGIQSIFGIAFLEKSSMLFFLS